MSYSRDQPCLRLSNPFQFNPGLRWLLPSSQGLQKLLPIKEWLKFLHVRYVNSCFPMNIHYRNTWRFYMKESRMYPQLQPLTISMIAASTLLHRHLSHSRERQPLKLLNPLKLPFNCLYGLIQPGWVKSKLKMKTKTKTNTNIRDAFYQLWLKIVRFKKRENKLLNKDID